MPVDEQPHPVGSHRTVHLDGDPAAVPVGDLHDPWSGAGTPSPCARRGPEERDWHRALDSGMLELVRERRLAEAKERLQACLSSSSA